VCTLGRPPVAARRTLDDRICQLPEGMVKTPSLLDIVKLLPARDLTRAARALGLTPETLVKRVGSLESVVGTKLMDTAARALKPGEAGRLVIDHASRIFSQARDFTRDLEELAGLQSPEIVFGTDMFVAEMPLGVALGRMATANSRLRVHAVVGDFDDLAKSVMAGRIEFAIADTTSAERHPTRLAIEPVAEHRVFFFSRPGHPLTAARDHSLETLLVFPLAATRVPHRIAMHIGRSMPSAKVERETGDLTPSLMLDSFAAVKAAVLAGDAIGLAPLTAIEPELRSGKVSLVPFDAPWLHLSYGLFYPRKRSLSRAAQLFVTQLRQVETDIQTREHKALARMNLKRRTARRGAKSGTAVPAKRRRAQPRSRR
jgi:DNA-binding transcriptional LysR family regulator